MAKRTTRTQRSNPAPTTNGAPTLTNRPDLRERLLADFTALKVPLTAAQLDAVLARAERGGLTHLEFAHLLIAEQAQQRRERAIANRIKDACFRDEYTLAEFDWDFNAQAIDRTQIEELATGAFIGRRDNLVFVGQSGVGKSRIVESVGRAACVLGYRVRYTTSADLLTDLTARLADHTLPKRLRYYARFDWLIIDEFAFDKIERTASPQAANLLYKIIDMRSQRSTTVVTNVDFDAWSTYLEDRQLAMAFLDRVVDGAIILKINGKSYRAHRANTKKRTATK
jgi:DNA replication protein DnaC